MPVSKKPRKPQRRRVDPGYLMSPNKITQVSLIPHTALAKLRSGLFGAHEWREYGTFANVVQLLAQDRRNAEIIAHGASTNQALDSMRQRAQRLGRWGCSGDEYVALSSAINPMDDFLRTCTVDQVKRALERLDLANAEMRQKNVHLLEKAA